MDGAQVATAGQAVATCVPFADTDGASRSYAGLGTDPKQKEQKDSSRVGADVRNLPRLRMYHDALFERYLALMQDERQAVGKMKEIWWYLGVSFPDEERTLRKIKKASGRTEYLEEVRKLLG